MLLLSDLTLTEPVFVVYVEVGLKSELFATSTVQSELPVEDQLSVADDVVTLVALGLFGCDCANTTTPSITWRTNIFAANFMESDMSTKV